MPSKMRIHFIAVVTGADFSLTLHAAGVARLTDLRASIGSPAYLGGAVVVGFDLKRGVK